MPFLTLFLEVIIALILSSVLVIFVHELGHFIFAFILHLHPYFTVGMDHNDVLPMPTIIVRYDAAERWKMALVSVMGFGLSMLVGVALMVLMIVANQYVRCLFTLMYWVVLTFHFIFYPFKKQGSDSNDFRHMV